MNITSREVVSIIRQDYKQFDILMYAGDNITLSDKNGPKMLIELNRAKQMWWHPYKMNNIKIVIDPAENKEYKQKIKSLR